MRYNLFVSENGKWILVGDFASAQAASLFRLNQYPKAIKWQVSRVMS